MGKVAIIGVPLDLGGNRRGVDMGPSAMRLTHLATRIKMLGYDVLDTGDIDVTLPEEAHIGDLKKKFAKEIGEVCQSQGRCGTQPGRPYSGHGRGDGWQ